MQRYELGTADSAMSQGGMGSATRGFRIRAKPPALLVDCGTRPPRLSTLSIGNPHCGAPLPGGANGMPKRPYILHLTPYLLKKIV